MALHGNFEFALCLFQSVIIFGEIEIVIVLQVYKFLCRLFNQPHFVLRTSSTCRPLHESARLQIYRLLPVSTKFLPHARIAKINLSYLTFFKHRLNGSLRARINFHGRNRNTKPIKKKNPTRSTRVSG